MLQGRTDQTKNLLPEWIKKLTKNIVQKEVAKILEAGLVI